MINAQNEDIAKLSINLARNLIKQFEGCKLTAYTDVVGIWTIGYGDTENVFPGMTIDQETADLRLERHIAQIYPKVLSMIKVPLHGAQIASLLDFVYNLGLGCFQRSTLRAMINRNELQDASNEFLKYCYAGGIKYRGLLRRRLAEQKLFLSHPA